MVDYQIVQDNYGFLFEADLLEEISKVGVLKDYPEGRILMDIGDNILNMPLLISGAIKILREDEQGDELLLYFLERGDTCAMTLNCCINNSKSKIRAIVEKDSKMILVPVSIMEEWIVKYNSWRNFVFDSYNIRLNEMLESIDSLAFMKMDERLLKYLNDQVMITKDTVIEKTHQEIANDLHTSRVVISRLLKKLENDNKLKLNRNNIEVLEY